MPPFLEEILASTRAGLPPLREARADLERRALAAPSPPSLAMALAGEAIGVIGEVKRRSPSAGDIAPALEPVDHARRYVGAGAAAVSVLTDARFFGGSLDDLAAVAGALPGTAVLRKDFILDPVQVLEARAAGAAAVLLIVRALPAGALAGLLREAESLGLAALVEVHGDGELDQALEAGARIIGVNARDLDTFAIDRSRAWRLLARVPGGCVAVAESGLRDLDDVRAAAAHGADAVLIGTALSASPDPGALIRRVREVPRRGR